MNYEEIVKAAFEDELEQIALAKGAAAPGELRPNTALSTGAPRMLMPKAPTGGLGLPKIAATRAVKEWQRANATGQQGVADQIAQGYGNLGLAPRQLKDISTGGEEAGVDLMMGRKAVPSTGEVNESGYVARKLYKPDSAISRGEYTPRLLAMKQEATDTARSLSPEARQMVPAMYGHETRGTGPLQRSVSYHEYVPGVSDLRGNKSVDPTTGAKSFSRSPEEAMSDVGQLQKHVIDPMAERGMLMTDTHRPKAWGEVGKPNWGNVVNSPQGPKVLDFLPVDTRKGIDSPAHESNIAYSSGSGSSSTSSQFGESTGVAPLRKEVFNPQMQIVPHAPVGAAPAHAFGARPAGSSAVTAAPPMHATPTALAGPRAVAGNRTALTAIQGRGMHAAESFHPTQLLRTPAVGNVLHAAEHSAATKVPGMLGRAGTVLHAL